MDPLYLFQLQYEQSTYSTVFEDDAFVLSEESLEGFDDAPQVGLVLLVVMHPLGVQHVMHGHQAVL